MRRLTSHLAALDRRLSARLQKSGGNSWLHRLAVLVTRSGDVLVFLGIVIAAFVLSGEIWRHWLIRLAIADVATFILVQILKAAVSRARPAGEWGGLSRRIDPYSFPSGHSARGGVVATLGLLIEPAWITALLMLWGGSVALSRVVVGMHYFSDVVSGFLIGAAVAVLVALVVF